MEPPGGQPPDRDKQLVLHQQIQPKPSFLRVTTTNEPSSTSSQQQQRHLHQLQQQSSQQSNTPSLSSSSVNLSHPPIERLSRPMAFDKMEALVREMQDAENGVPVRQQKMFLTSIPYAFMGYDLIEWLMDHLSIEESEALNIANQLCFHGYFFPVNDTKSLVVKDDSSLYRFQTPYYWPWQHKAPDNVEYAIYLAKRSLRNKQRHGLEDYESDALSSLNKNLKGKWDFISMQAEEQVRLAKERKKGDKIVGDSQERAYWRVHRPPPGQFTPLEPCPVPSRDRQGIKPKKKNLEDYQREVDYLQKSLGRTRMKMSLACESLVTYSETFAEFDFFLHPVLPSNPWVTEDLTFWQLNGAIVDIPTEKRVKRWAISIEELVSDPTGLGEFTTFLEKEYSHENIRFWLAVTKLKRSAQSQVAGRVNEIYEEFLKPGAPCEINIDSKTMDIVQKGLKNPTRFTYDAAAEHIYMLLLKKDCYPRFIRSDHYKNLLATGIQPLHKKRFFNFGGVGVKKLKNTTAAASSQPTTQTQLIPYTGSCGPGPSIANLSRRRGSDRSLTGSAHELAVIGVKDVSSKVPHSHSQSNLSEIPYGRDIPKTVAAKLETTVESCSVCPWDSPEVPAKTPKVTESPTITTSTTVQVCPWDEDSKLPPTPTCTRKSSNGSDKKSSAADKLPRNTDIKFESKISPAPSPPPPPPELDIDLVEEDASSEHKTPSPQKQGNESEKDECELLAKMKIVEAESGKTESKEIQTDTTAATISIESATTPASSSPTSDNRDDKEPESDKEESTNQTEVNPLSSLGDTINVEDDIKQESDVHPIATEEDVESEETEKEKTVDVEIKVVVEEEKDSGIAEEQQPLPPQPPEELSPTTEGYQESTQDVYDYEIGMCDVDGSSISAGYVAPAPTPAPSLAPLATIETDVVDDELDATFTADPDKAEQPSTSTTALARNKSSNEESKKRKKKRTVSEEKKLEESDNGAPKSAEADRNTVCPWEDEDGSTSDATFVKTYATFGYL